MKIETLHLRNFRSFHGTTLDLDSDKVYICGRNGVGKTTIKTAIRWALTGLCEQTDGRGLGWQTMVPDGSDTLAVGLKFGHDLTVERGYTPNDKALLVNNNPAEITIAQNAIYAGLHVQPSWLNAVLETGYFVDLSHADAKAMVLSLLDVKVEIDLTPLETDPAKKQRRRMTMDEVQAEHKSAFAKRTAAKAALKNHVVPAFQEPPDGEMPAVEDVKQRLVEIRSEKERLLATSGNIAGQRQALQQELARLSAVPAEIVPPAPNAADVEAVEAAIAEAETAMDAAVKELAAKPALTLKPKGPIEFGLIPVETLRTTATALMNHQPKQGCVLDSGVSCDVAKIKFTNRAKAIREEITARGESAFDDTVPVPQQSESDAAVDALRKTLTALREQRDRMVKAQGLATAATASNARRTATLADLQERLGGLQDDTETNQTLGLLDSRIQKGEMFQTRCEAYWREKTRYEAAKAKQTALALEVQHFEALVEELGPKGAMMRALDKAKGEFESRINHVTQKFGWTVRFEMDPWRVWVNQRPLEAYSESQRFRIGIAVQMAVAALSGLGFIIVDRLDMLDMQNRAEMTQLLLRSDEADVQQVIILATRDEGVALPAVEGLLAYRLALDDQERTQIVEAVRP